MRLSSCLLATVLCGVSASPAHAQYDFTRQWMDADSTGSSSRASKRTRAPASEEIATEAKTGSPDQQELSSPVVVPPSKKESRGTIGSSPAEADPGVLDQVRGLLKNEDDTALVRYEQRIESADPRLNRLEIEGRAGIASLRSASTYSYRDGESSFGVMDVRSNVWLTPAVGLSGGFRFSLGASVHGDDAGLSDLVRDEEIEMGARFRQYFGSALLSPSLDFGLYYTDHSFNVSMDSVRRVRWRSDGLGLGLRARWPSSSTHAWIAEGRIFPRLHHQESKTSVDVSSGGGPEGARLDLEIGGELGFGREHQITYGLQLSTERDAFSGAASAVDPQTGSTPSNVTATSTFVNFLFGYRWGR